MTGKKNPWEGLDLAGQVTTTGPLDQQLFQSRPRPERAVAQDSVASSETRKLVNKETGKQDSVDTSDQEIPLPSTLQKATFGLPSEVLDTLEDIKRTLRRTYGIKLSKEKIVAEAIQQLNEDLEKNKERSFLVNTYTRKEGDK